MFLFTFVFRGFRLNPNESNNRGPCHSFVARELRGVGVFKVRLQARWASTPAFETTVRLMGGET